MRISCPSCQTVYDVPDTLLGAGPKAMRCARCAREWTVEPAVTTAIAAPLDFVAPLDFEAPRDVKAPRDLEAPLDFDDPRDLEAPREPVVIPRPSSAPEPNYRPVPAMNSTRPLATRQPRPERRSRGALIGWILSLLAITAVVVLAVLYRDDLMAIWPPSQRLFRGLGLR